MEMYSSLVEAINALRKQGYTEDFNLRENCLVCQGGKYNLLHDEFHVDNYFRFDGMTNPEDESILYAISSEPHGLKGLLVNGYGIYSDPMSSEIAQKLKMD